MYQGCKLIPTVGEGIAVREEIVRGFDNRLEVIVDHLDEEGIECDYAVVLLAIFSIELIDGDIR